MSSSTAPPLSSRTVVDEVARRASRAPAPSRRGRSIVGQQRDQPVHPQPLRCADRGTALDQAVGQQQQPPARRQRQLARGPARRRRRRRAAGPVAVGPIVGAPPPVAEQHRRRVPGAAHGRRRAVRRDGHRRDGGEDLLGVALVHEHLLQRGQHVLDVHAAERLRPPATRRHTPSAASSAPWPLTSPIMQVHGAVARVHEVVEVAAQERALATRAIAGADEQRRVVEDRDRQQPALQARRLLGQDLGRPQLLAHAVGLAALDGVEDRPPQAVAVDAALDEVVLRARGDRVDAALVVAVAGEDEVRDVRRRLAQALERVQPAGVRQPEVEQDAVEGLRAQERRAPRGATARGVPAPAPPPRAAARRPGRRRRGRPRPAARERRRPRSGVRALVWRGRGGHGEDAGPGARSLSEALGPAGGAGALTRGRPALRARPRRRTARRRRASRSRSRWR